MIYEDINLFTNQTDVSSSEAELCQERFGMVKNLVLDSVKSRWIKHGRRGSTASQISVTSSKRDREEGGLLAKNTRPRVFSPGSAGPV